MKRFKSFVLEGDIIQFPGGKREEPSVKSHIQNMKEKIRELEPTIRSIADEPLHKEIVKDMSPAITSQYKGTVVPHVEQLHQHMTFPDEDIHPDIKIGRQRKAFAVGLARKHKQAILDHLDDKIDRAQEVVSKYGNMKEVSAHFNSAGGIIGHLKKMRDDFNRIT